MESTKNVKPQCAACSAWDMMPDVMMGRLRMGGCHRLPPVPLVQPSRVLGSGDMHVVSAWPPVPETGWCMMFHPTPAFLAQYADADPAAKNEASKIKLDS